MNQNVSGCGYHQNLVHQNPNYDNRVVVDRRLKIQRPTKKMTKRPHQPKWL